MAHKVFAVTKQLQRKLGSRFLQTRLLDNLTEDVTDDVEDVIDDFIFRQKISFLV